MPSSAESSTFDIEREIDAYLTSGAVASALSLAVRAYGPEVLSFLRALHGDAEQASEVFAQACEDLVRNAAAFRRECGFRTWFYAVARHASLRFRAQERRHGHRRLSTTPEVAQAVRSTTAAYLKTEWKDRFRQLRERLSEEERLLLILRVDRNLAWREIAQIWEGPDGTARCSEAALRKRFERLKADLRRSAEAAGWWAEL